MLGDEGRRYGARGSQAKVGWLDRIDLRLCRSTARHPYVRFTGLLVILTAITIAGSRILNLGETQLSNYPTLHAFLETCSIVVCVMVFVVAQASGGGRRSRNMMLLGVAFLGVALLDFAHTHSYAGMPDFVTPSNPEKAINFWLAARLLSAAALLAVAYLSWDRLVPERAMFTCTARMLAGVCVVVLIVIYWPDWIPSTFIPGQGLTPFKIWVEVSVIAISLAAAVGFCRLISRRPLPLPSDTGGFDPVALMCATILTAMAEVFLTIYTDVNGLFNLIGHIYKLVGAWFIYRGLVAVSLFEVRTRAKLALDAAQLGTWSWEPETDSLEIDDFAAALWGLPSGAQTTLQAIEEMVHPEDRSTRLKAFERAIDPAGDGRYFAEFRIIPPGGGTRHIVSRGATEFRLGKPIRLVGVVRDDTRRREAQHLERRSEARLSGILSIAADAIISIDEKGRIVLFNQGAEKIFGYADAEVMGQPLETLIPQRFRASHEGHIQRFAASGTTAQRMGERQEVAGLRKDGSEFPAEASISKLVIDGNTTFTVVLRDVTERKRLEVELERRVIERTAELSALLDAVPDGIVQTNKERQIRVPNAAMSQLFGYGRDELIGRPSSMLFASDLDHAAVDEAWRALDSGKTFDTLTVECRRKDGSTFTAMVRGSVVREADGSVMSRVGMIRDVTEELKRQKALSVAQRMEAFGQLTGGIAHDFNNLLTVITGNHELLEMRLTDERQITLLKRAQAAAEMGARLTSRLLTFARRRQLSTSLLSLNEQIAQMVDLLQRSIGEQITLTTNLSPKLPLVKADPSEIENAVLNLAINARDAMPNGGTIVIETSEHIVDASGLSNDTRLKPGHYVRLSVTDTGSGMSAEVASHAFEPFFTTKPRDKGTGLGLSTIHGFAQQSGGTVSLYSEPGLGTTVSIYLPRVDEDGRQSAIALDDEALRVADGETVLLVEDNHEVRQVARQIREGLGYKVDEVQSGVAAIDELRRGGAGKYDVVFCDVVMPGGVSGFDVARWIATHAPNLRILLTSGYPDEVAGGGHNNQAGVPLLHKPYSRIELARALRGALDRQA